MEINFSLVDVEFSLHLWLGTEQHLCPPQAAVAALKIDCGLPSDQHDQRSLSTLLECLS